MFISDLIEVPEGMFELRAYDPDGKLVDYVHGQNIVVDDGREALARLLGNAVGPEASYYVDTMKFGDGGHDTDDETIMLPVYVTDDDLYGNEIISVDVTGAGTTWPALKKVAFTATIEANEGNGGGTQPYSEAGLFYAAGTKMFAHKAFGYIVKNSTIRLVATWTFTF